MDGKIRRRDFLRGVAGVGAAALLGGCAAKRGAPSRGAGGAAAPRVPSHIKQAKPILAIAKGGTIEARTRAAVDAVGGMGGFVKRGDTVVIKPNAAWQRAPEQAATTNPKVIAELIRLCKQQGAAKVLVVEHMIDSPPRLVWDITGLGAAVAAAGAQAIAAQDERAYAKMDVPRGKVLTSDEVIRDVLDADVFINVPIAKVHSGSVMSASMKNLMGVVWNRQYWHQADLQQCIADFASALRPDLIVLDATRVLLTQGPKGPGKTRDVGQVVASFDPVATDAYAATLLDLTPQEVPHIELASQLGAGEKDLGKVQTKHVQA